MKKVSTVAAKPGKKISQPKLTIGLDLGDRNSWYCVLDESGQIQLEQRVRTNAKGLREVFGELPHSRIALEIGTHSPWISRLLSELGHEVMVANARKVRLIGESRKKDDRLDARTLARLARIDPQLLCPVKHRSAKAQADLTVIRARAGLVRARTALVNTARGLAKSYGERLRGCNVRNLNPEKAEALSPELPLQPQISGLPSFGPVAGIFYALVAMLMMLLMGIGAYRSKGLRVGLLKQGTVPQNSDIWTEPLIVQVKHSAPGQTPDLQVNSKLVAWEDFDRVLKQELSRRSHWVVYIGADDEVAWQDVVRVVDEAHRDHATVYLITATTKASRLSGNQE